LGPLSAYDCFFRNIEQRLELGNDVPGILGFGHVMIATHPLALMVIVVLVEGREQDDLGILVLGALLDPLADLESGLAAENHIEYDGVGFFLLYEFAGLFGGDGLSDGEAVHFKEEAEDLADARFIVDEKYTISLAAHEPPQQ